MAAPTITSFSPTTAGPGDLVTITGTGLTGTTAVSFGGHAALRFIIVSSIYITAIVNTGATGSVSVTNPDGVATLAGFTFTSDPCFCNNFPVSCIPAPLIPVCDDPEYCEDLFADKCIVHKGTNLTNLSAPDGTRLDVILSTINTKINSFVQVANYAAMVALGVQTRTVVYKVLADEHKSLTNTLYIWWVDGVRIYIASTIDS